MTCDCQDAGHVDPFDELRHYRVVPSCRNDARRGHTKCRPCQAGNHAGRHPRTKRPVYVMFDIEARGQRPTDAIVSIGAVTFTHGKILDAEFYVEISQEDSFANGFTTDPDTDTWWAKQSPEARKALQGSTPVREALQLYADWLKAHPNEGVWAHPTRFDCVRLQHAYQHLNMPLPWSLKLEFDQRTALLLHPQAKVGAGVEHNALDDARNQAHRVAQALLCSTN